MFYRVCPDPFVIAILLMTLTAALALMFGRFPGDDNSLPVRAAYLLDAWRADDGLWKLLAFGMQMCLVLVTGHALAATKPVRGMIDRVANWPRTAHGASALVALVACVAGLVNWGLGLIVGAVLAREVGRSCQRRHVSIHYPLLAAAGYMGLLIFHGGLSGSAPLASTTAAGARKVLPESAMALIGEGIGLDRTLFSPLNVCITGGMLVLLPALFWLLTPKRPADMRGFVEPPRVATPPPSLEDLVSQKPHPGSISIPDRLDHSPIVVWLLAIPLLAAVVRHAFANGLWNTGLNEINATMLALGLILHASPRAYGGAIEDAARDCGAIILQFPIYAGIMALMKVSGLVGLLTEYFIKLGSAHSLPALSFVAATIVGLFVPSGGAQWGLQGEITLRAAAATGADQGAMLMSVAYGDELANMLQPFWALPLLAITGVKARDIVGYTSIVMVVTGAWIALGLLVF